MTDVLTFTLALFALIYLLGRLLNAISGGKY